MQALWGSVCKRDDKRELERTDARLPEKKEISGYGCRRRGGIDDIGPTSAMKGPEGKREKGEPSR